MADWYRQLDGQATGPFTFEELRFLRDRGSLADDDQIRRGTSGSWQRAGSITQLFPTARQAVAPAPLPDPVPEPVETPSGPTRVAGPPPNPPRSAAALPQGSVETDQRDRLIITLTVGAGLAMLLMLLLLLLLWLFWDAGGGSREVAGQNGAGGGTGGGIGAGTGDSNGDGTEGEGESAEDDASSSGASDMETSEDLTADQEETGEAPEDEPDEESSEEPPQVASSGEERPEEEPMPKSSFSIARLPSGTSDPAGGSSGGGAGGGSGAFEERLEREGAKSGDVQVSLIWNNYNDLDLHVVCPSREEIYYQRKRSRCGGELDVDMNAGGRESREPVENIYWPPGRAPKGKFLVIVNHYANHRERDPTRFSIAVKVDGETREFSGSISHGQPRKLIHEFTRR